MNALIYCKCVVTYYGCLMIKLYKEIAFPNMVQPQLSEKLPFFLLLCGKSIQKKYSKRLTKLSLFDKIYSNFFCCSNLVRFKGFSCELYNCYLWVRLIQILKSNSILFYCYFLPKVPRLFL